MGILSICIRFICVCFYMITCSCLSGNTNQFDHDTNQCQMDSRSSTNCNINKGQNCIELPYYNDKSSTIELLTFIFHGNHNATLTNVNDAQMYILYQPSLWGAQHTLQVQFFDNFQQIRICPENHSDWFRSKKHFLLSIQQKYLNVASNG